MKNDVKNDVCVVALDKGTNFIQTVTSCDLKDSQKYAKYYRSIGYNSKVLSYEELEQMQENETQYKTQFERSENI